MFSDLISDTCHSPKVSGCCLTVADEKAHEYDYNSKMTRGLKLGNIRLKRSLFPDSFFVQCEHP